MRDPVTTLDRRELLALAAAVCAHLALPGTGAALQDETAALADLAHEVDTPALRSLGRRYLSLYPAEGDPEWLEEQLAAVVESGRLEESLGEAIRADFADDRMLQIDHWFLSRTECRVCGLLALREGP